MFAQQLRQTPVRLVVLAIGFLAVNAAFIGPLAAMVNQGNPLLSLLTLVLGVAAAVAEVWLYRWVIRKVEHREATELAAVDVAALRRGTLLGLGMFCVVMLLITIFGGYDSLSWGSFFSVFATAGLMAAVAVIEEIIFRGILFRLLEQMTGTLGAMIGSAVVFGGLHLINDPTAFWGALAIAIQGGLMLAACYAVTRSLWLPIGLHFGWNFAESGIFGTTVSGSSNSGGGLFHSVLDGPTLISGGDFGPEATVFAVLVCSALTLHFVRKMRALSKTEAQELAAV
ncbi:type II CAAX endopeptidase family protein [Kineosporia sp. NBRC 101731]|uniref:CPBP family intramembrane glutamic endopeptidase n=1 Tax=Kineosporia sp. NBRC 101731 TaxID=3032199 RepID=UPI0024A50E98|nr:type II CAAX endopeptidase family protein [Kineosporia sp. NBRC 101731]GLY26810.1 CAAX amino protease [Kineosporia sp. NBRC 101731]